MMQQAIVLNPGDFLAHNGWEGAARHALPADWSQKQFARIRHPRGDTAFLLHDYAGDTIKAFQRIGKIFQALDLSAPTVIAADPAHGWLLLEDFGDGNMGRMMDSGAAIDPLLERALETLVALQQRSMARIELWRDLPRYDPARFIDLLGPFVNEMVPKRYDVQLSLASLQAFNAAWEEVLKFACALPQCFMHRDFMADNLMDLPDRTGVRSVGLLDFDLAGGGPAAYDLASLTEQVRRDYGEERRIDLINRYCRHFPDYDVTQVARATSILGAQRHLRIVALLDRLIRQPQHQAKRVMQKRAQTHVLRLLDLPALKPVREWFQAQLPTFLTEQPL